MITAAVHGRLAADPVERETKGGKPMTTAKLAVPANRAGDADATLWLSIAAFGSMAEMLARHFKGETLAVSGTISLRKFTDKLGQERETWQMTIDSLISARSVRPKGNRAPAGQKRAAAQQSGDPRPFDDPLEGPL